MGNNQAERVQQAAKLYGAASPDVQAQIMGLLQAMVNRQGRQQAAIRQAVIHGSFADIEHGAKVIEGITFAGANKNILEEYSNCPFALAGIAYTAGIAEGKQRERDRRRHAAIKQAIKETGNVPPEYME